MIYDKSNMQICVKSDFADNSETEIQLNQIKIIEGIEVI